MFPPDIIVRNCPGCELWQVDYDDHAATSFATYTLVDTGIQVNIDGFYKAIDEILEEHLNECKPLQLLYQEMTDAADDSVAEEAPATA